MIERGPSRSARRCTSPAATSTCTSSRGASSSRPRRRLIDLPLPRLNGRHQIDNAGTAIAAASLVFGDALTTRALEHGLTHAEWPARLERLAAGGLHAYVADGTEIWLDGGHNAAGGQVIAHALAELDERVPRPVHLIFGHDGDQGRACLHRSVQGPGRAHLHRADSR